MSRPLHNFRVCIDSRMLSAGGTGVSTYARALRATLPLVAGERLLLQDGRPAPLGRMGRWLSAVPRGIRGTRPVSGGDEAIVEGRDLFRVAQVHFDVYGTLMRVALPGPAGIMHWTYPVPLRAQNWINVYTVHDAIPLLTPELTTISSRRHGRMLAAIAKTADAIATVSDAARSDIAAVLGGSAPPIVNCGIAVEGAAAPDLPLPRGLTTGGYLLVCGSIEPRKNVARILAAFRASGVTIPLVFAGPDGAEAATFRADIAATPGAMRLPYLPEDRLRALIAGARALLMPSLAEGFGLPIVEAMALGTPVLTADRGALAETAGGAALLVDPLDEQALAAGIIRLVNDDALRARLVAAGLDNARRFTRERFAERLGALYASLPAHG